MSRLYPITPRNSMVNGSSARGWGAVGPGTWFGGGDRTLVLARAWVDPGPSPAGNAGPYLKAPVIEADGSDDGVVYRVYPANARGKPVKRDGRWWWSYER